MCPMFFAVHGRETTLRRCCFAATAMHRKLIRPIENMKNWQRIRRTGSPSVKDGNFCETKRLGRKPFTPFLGWNKFVVDEVLTRAQERGAGTRNSNDSFFRVEKSLRCWTTVIWSVPPRRVCRCSNECESMFQQLWTTQREYSGRVTQQTTTIRTPTNTGVGNMPSGNMPSGKAWGGSRG